jgi:hypothetical protein
MHLRLDRVLQLLSHEGYSIFSLIDDILNLVLNSSFSQEVAVDRKMKGFNYYKK